MFEEITSSAVPHIVAVEPDHDKAVLYRRESQTSPVTTETIPFQPFILLMDAALLTGFPGHWEPRCLSGNEMFRVQALFSDIPTFDEARKFLRQVTGVTAGSPNSPYKVITDLTQQILISAGIRLFSGMHFEDVLRMQVDIETLCDPAYEFPNPDRETDSIILIAMSDSSGWEHVISAQNLSEKEMLEEFVRIVQQRDPDIIEGHNFFRFDLPYIETRAKRHKVKLALGRNGSAPKKRASRFNVAERTVNYTRYDIYGRHIADTYHLALFYDSVKRDLDGYSLKTIAKHFHVAAPDRVYINAGNMNEEWAANPERAAAYCLDDVRETRAISDLLSPSTFYQTGIIPLSYQNCIVRGNATRIDSLFLAEYLKEGMSIPVPEYGRPFAGALTRSFDAGVFENVMHCDVRSLYPSIILSQNWSPSRDKLGVFRKFLDRLRTFRLQAKDAARAEQDPLRKNYLSSLQAAFKILINSFYGYLGFDQGFLNDFNMAERVTSLGREILESMLNYLLLCGAKVIEMDTDGIYFQPPASGVDAIREGLPQVLPPGIEVDFDESYPAMFSYKSKNYALLKENGELALAGAALKSRGLEPFQRKYIHRIILALLHKDGKAIRDTDAEFESALREHRFPLADLAKSETLSDSLETYAKKAARKSAAYELAIASGRACQPGDQVTFYVTGDKKKVSVTGNSKLLADADPAVRDENVEYYLGKLEELQKKFAPFVPQPDGDDFRLE